MNPAEAATAGGQSKGTLRVVQLYPRDMNIYGDWGNALVLQRRIQWHGYTPELLEYNVGDPFPADVDIIVGGGGQDSGQLVIQDDLQARAGDLKELAEDGAPMLLICGLYQLFGRFFKTRTGSVSPGIGHRGIRRGPWIRKPQRSDDAGHRRAAPWHGGQGNGQQQQRRP